MKAGATSRRDVGQVYEFPENFRRDRRRAMLMLGLMTSVHTLFVLGAAITEPSPTDGFIFPMNGMMWLLLVVIAVSRRPLAFRDGMVEFDGRLHHPDEVMGLDIVIDHGRPGARWYKLKLVATFASPSGPMFRVVRTKGKTGLVRAMLAEVRQRLPHAVVRDLSGLIEPVTSAPVTNWPSPVPITTVTQVLPAWSSPTHPRIVPERMSQSRPSWAPLPRPAQDGRRGERHLERLALAREPRPRTCLRTPSVVAEWF